MEINYKALSSLVNRKIGYGIVQPGDSVPNGVPVIKVFNILAGLKSIDSLDTTKAENAAKYSRTKLNGGELIVSVVGTVGRTAIVPMSFAGCNLVRATALVDIPDETIALWVKYYIDSPGGQLYIDTNLNTTVQPTLNIKSLESMPIPFFEGDYMEKAVSILSRIDEKIKLNVAINENLEQQAQAIFKAWFVDFEPFGGIMPDDWRIGTASEIIELHDSKRVPLSGAERDKMDKIYPYYGATSRMDYVDNYLFDGIYLLLGEDGTVIDANGFPILQYVYGKFWVNNHAHIITGKLGYTVESLYLLFSLTNIKHIVTGAVQQKVSQANLKKVPVIIPNAHSLERFNTIIQPIFATIRNYRDENERLAALRDTLLPKLMNGEIDVSAVRI